MRLLFCTTDGAGAFNGINTWLLDFLPALAAAGHQPLALVFAWSPGGVCHTVPLLKARGVPVRVVFPMLYTEAAVRRCVRETRSFRPHVFVANHVLPALLALPAIQARGVPGVSVLHNDDDEYRTKAAYPADATVAISRGLLRMLPDDGRLVRHIPYGVPLSPKTATPPPPGAPFRIIYHGRIAQTQKRILETAAALVRVCHAHPRLHADLHGSGPDEAALREQLSRDDAEGRVRFLGSATATELRARLPRYHVSVLLSDFEGLGLSVLESMSAGLVPVCHRIASGLPDLIDHGRNGCFVSDRAADFEATILRLLHHPEEWKRLSLGARTSAEHRFSPAASLGAWQELLRALPPRPAASRPFRIPPPSPRLAGEDLRHPGPARALWRWLRFGPSLARRPW